MLNGRTLIVLAVNIVLLLAIFLWLQRHARLNSLGSAKALVENVEKVERGDSKARIEGLLGRADSLTDKEWLYYLDEHSGYSISFDAGGRVESVHSWRS